MALLSSIRARLSRRSQNKDRLKAGRSEKARYGWLSLNWGGSATVSDAPNPPITSIFRSTPNSVRCSDQTHQCIRNDTFASHNDTDLVHLQKAWFARRASSLNRLSASHMIFKEEVHSPRPPRCFEYVPFVLDVSSEGIEMELDDWKDRPEPLVPELGLKDLRSLIAKIEAVDKDQHMDGHSNITNWSPSSSPSYNAAAVLELDASDGEIEASFPSPQYHPTHRPAPNDISRTRPTSFIEHQCNISDTPFTLPDHCQTHAKSSSSYTPTRPYTAATSDSGLIFDWW